MSVREIGWMGVLAGRLRDMKPDSLLYRLVFGLAAMTFAVGLFLSLASTSIKWSQVNWFALLLVVCAGVPAMTVANAYEYQVSARILRLPIGAAHALRTTVLATAANLLPLPGGSLVRTKGLMNAGGSGRRAIAVTIGMAIAWLGVALLMAGVLGGLRVAAAIGVGAVGILVLATATMLLRRVAGSDRLRSLLGQVALAELMATIATAGRIWLVGAALGTHVGLGAFVLGAAPVLGAIVVVVPAGLGVRELVAAGTAPAIGLDPGVGYLITALDRIAGLIVHGLFAAVIALVYRRAGSQAKPQ